MKHLILLLSLLVGHTDLAAGLTPEDISSLPSGKIEKALPKEHPSAYYLYANRLFGEEKRDDAVFWFYVGQLRYRVHLQSNPNLDPSGDPALFGSLNATVGQIINEYAGGDPKMWVKQMNRALDWDARNNNGFTSKRKNKVKYEETREGLKKLISNIESSIDEVRKQREANGLEDRG